MQGVVYREYQPNFSESIKTYQDLPFETGTSTRAQVIQPRFPEPRAVPTPQQSLLKRVLTWKQWPPMDPGGTVVAGGLHL